MSATHGRIKEFCPESSAIDAYLERVELYFEANHVNQEEQVPVFLSVIGEKTYMLLRSLVSPAKPRSKSLEQLVATLKKHYAPKRIVIAERFRFFRRNQAVGESIAEYEAELRRLATHCDFEAYLEQAIRDKLVCGMRNAATQKRLLSKADLTLERALEIAQSEEAAESNSLDLKSGDVAVHDVESKQKECYRCGRRNHSPRECRFRDAECHRCGKLGHISRMCRRKPGPSKSKEKKRIFRGRRTKWVQADGNSDGATDSKDSAEDSVTVYKVTKTTVSCSPITAQLQVNGKPLSMEVDTGAAVSIISEETQKRYFPNAVVRPSGVRLRTYTEETMAVLGEMTVSVVYEHNAHDNLSLFVVQGNGPSLLGRSWLQRIRLNWRALGIATVRKVPSLPDALLHKYATVFDDGQATMHPFKATLSLKSGAEPRFHRPRPVPFALKEAVGRELDRLEELGVLERVSYSRWAAPIVPVPKKDGQIRLCGDFKVTVNPMLEVDQYPLPKPDDLFATLAGGHKFTKLDLKQAYQQMPLDETSKDLVTINTHQGLYRFTQLPFRVASAPALFQRAMDSILQGIPRVICYIDDILISGSSEENHLSNLEEVLKQLQHHGVKLRAAKCAFLQDSVEFLGHTIDNKGLHTSTRKVEAVQKAPTPKNQQELRSFLGLVHYYGKFLPNLSTLLHPLNELLKAGQRWKWTPQCEQAFKEAKQRLTEAPVLAHYDPTLPLRLAGDASSYGLGAVISHTYPDGTERPVAFASRTLTSSERNYSQLEREALSLVFGITRFHQYLYGRSFQLLTDHKPLTTILSPKTGIPSLAAARLQRWALLLSGYKYQIQYKSTKEHSNADGLSRLPLEKPSSSEALPVESVFNIHQIAALPVSSRQIAEHTRRHPVLSRVLHHVQHGWPTAKVLPVMQPFWTRRDELTVEQGCLLWGMRVIVPHKLQNQVLKELHSSHPGIVRMKSIARSYVWWPGLNEDLETLVKGCPKCQSCRSAPAVAPLHPWLWPTHPWQRIHVDFAGPIDGRMMLVIVDAHSKWPEVIPMYSTTSQMTIRVLRRLFATFGLPQQLVSDNGPQFTSEEFAEFLTKNGVKHIRSSPYHPSTNGLAERFVRTLKNALRNSHLKDSDQKLMDFLLSYRSTPHSTTNTAPCLLFLQRPLRTTLDLLRPDLADAVLQGQSAQKRSHDQHSRRREFFIGERVLVRNLREGPRWLLGTVTERRGPLSYLVQVASGQVWKRHVDHLLETIDSPRKEELEAEPETVPVPQPEPEPAPVSQPEPEPVPVPQPVPVPVPQAHPVLEPAPTSPPPPVPVPNPSILPMTRRYPVCVRHKPDRYQAGL